MGLFMYIKLKAPVNLCEAMTQGSSLTFIFNMDFSTGGNFIDDFDMLIHSSISYS